MTFRTFALIVVGLLAVAAAGPRVDAQPAPTVAKIGLLSVTTPAVLASAIQAFRQTLRERGHVEGTFVLAVRYSAGRFERLPELARELGLKVDEGPCRLQGRHPTSLLQEPRGVTWRRRGHARSCLER